MTPEELKQARELVVTLRKKNEPTRDYYWSPEIEWDDAADTITRLCDEVEKLQRESKCPTRPTCEALARSVMADQTGRG